MWALLLERTHPRLATDVHYVAGDRVVSDPLCKPFSMGRNLFCVHSKKHLDDIPELKEEKVRTNRQTLVAMSRQLNKVGLVVVYPQYKSPYFFSTMCCCMGWGSPRERL